jgi:hypothetical protein
MELSVTRRTLRESERRMLRAKERVLESDSRRARKAPLKVGSGVLVFLWLLTLSLSNGPYEVVTGFWAVVGVGILLWVARDARIESRDLARIAQGCSSALRSNRADVYGVRAVSFAEFEEVDDEGACYAFQLPNEHVLFVSGQEFYESARFPCLEFDLVHVFDEGDRPVDMMIHKRGPKALPALTVPASEKLRLEIPEHLETRRGSIHELDRILKAR